MTKTIQTHEYIKPPTPHTPRVLSEASENIYLYVIVSPKPPHHLKRIPPLPRHI